LKFAEARFQQWLILPTPSIKSSKRQVKISEIKRKGNNKDGYFDQASSLQSDEEVTGMLQSMTIATANVLHVDAILDSGASQ
jgi:hypothetical protein